LTFECGECVAQQDIGRQIVPDMRGKVREGETIELDDECRYSQ